MLDVFIKAGADINKATDEGETALMRAASRAHLACVNLLINAGADVNISFGADSRFVGRTALGLAVEHIYLDGFYQFPRFQRVNRVKRLLQAGAHVNKENNRGQNALLYIIARMGKAYINRPRNRELMLLLFIAGTLK